MADNQSDILEQVISSSQSPEDSLKSIDQNIRKLLEETQKASGKDSRTDRPKDRQPFRPDDPLKLSDQFQKEFAESFKKGMQNAFKSTEVEDTLRESLYTFADALGVSVEDVGKESGSILGQALSNTLGDSSFGKTIKAAKENYANKVSDLVNKGAENLRNAKAAGVDVTAGLGTLTKSIGLGSKEMLTLAGKAGAAGLALVALDVMTGQVMQNMAETSEKFDAAKKSLNNAFNVEHQMSQQMIKSAQERLSKDFNSMIETSYDIMEDAAQKMLDAWDSSLQTITATQGYTKSDLQDLISSYAQRLKDEGLSSVVSSADITSNLAKVLDSGLSGDVANEFAYIATKLNAAVPTEDFFSYASTYAAIAANKVAEGYTKTDAIEYANQQLEEFASNLLYSSRELAGGFSSGLSNASTLFEQANKIANASHTGDVSNISSILTSVSAVVGAVAPTVASSLVDNVVSAALGGNSSDIAALRSLSGVGASNTAFLQALAEDPQTVFSTLFSNLGNLQTMSSSNYMEVAEGLSGIFGVSMDALSQVDFTYLAQQIDAMNTSNTSLDENMKMLASGQTTLTAEQQRMAEINEYMINEGLSYVLDNEVARQIQQHMWDEQLANEMMEATYGVELVGSTQELLESLLNTVSSILNFLNPLYWLKKGADLLAVASNTKSMEKDIAAVLEAGKIGQGNSAALYNLTTRGKDLNLAKSYIERLGMSQNVGLGSQISKIANTAYSLTPEGIVETLLRNKQTNSKYSGAYSQTTVPRSTPTSAYNWGLTSKSALTSSGYTGAYDPTSSYSTVIPVSTAQTSIADVTADRMQKYLNTMQSYVDENKSYDEWVNSATQYGITDVDAALSDFGLSAADAQKQFEDLEAQAASKLQYDAMVLESQFYEDAIQWYEETWPELYEEISTWHEELTEWQDLLIQKSDEAIAELTKSNKNLMSFYNEWTDYYVNHTAYTAETLSAYDISAIRNAEKSETGDAILALADALTSNAVDLKDPAVQTNVLLSKILLVAQAIMQQTNDTSTVSLPTTLAALGLGTISTQ